MKHYNIDDICVEPTLGGMIICSVIDNYGAYIRITYVGIGKSRALKQFKKHLSELYKKETI